MGGININFILRSNYEEVIEKGKDLLTFWKKQIRNTSTISSSVILIFTKLLSEQFKRWSTI